MPFSYLAHGGYASSTRYPDEMPTGPPTGAGPGNDTASNGAFSTFNNGINNNTFGGLGVGGGSTIQFQLPDYLYDAPPTLASGGGAEALHPAVAAQWFANSGFQRSLYSASVSSASGSPPDFGSSLDGQGQGQGSDGGDGAGDADDGAQYPAVADAWSSIAALHSHFAGLQAQAPMSVPSLGFGLGRGLGFGMGLFANGDGGDSIGKDNATTHGYGGNVGTVTMDPNAHAHALAAWEGTTNGAAKNSNGTGPTMQRPPAAPPHPQIRLTHAPPHTPSPLPASLSLPVYSQSGFDVVSLLARVQNRRAPQIHLGPIDFTTSFCVVDVRRHDAPIVYCSPSFCALTGYREGEVLGRNCRFLQAPPSAPPLVRGAQRHHTSAAAVQALAKAVGGGKETQVSVVNYRKDGAAFVNLVSVVPLCGEFADDDDDGGEVVWYVGFQVDLGRQSEGIVERVREGRYYKGAVLALQAQANAPPASNNKKNNNAGGNANANANGQQEGGGQPAPTRERRSTAVPAPRVSTVLARLLSNPRFLASCGVHLPAKGANNVGFDGTGEYTKTASGGGGGLPPDPASHALHCLLLQELPDFVHVLSLKGAFLYVAPAVTRVLGWAPAELVGRALADVCFKRDVVAVGRALKEASLPIEGLRTDESGKGSTVPPADTLRPVDLVFRALTKSGAWVWVECRGRLHVEPGKGRKAIVLVGRARAMARVGDCEMSMSPHSGRIGAAGQSPPTSTTYPPSWAPKRARMEESIGGALVSTCASSSSSPLTSTALSSPADAPASAATPTAFHGLLDPHGLLISVGAGAQALLGWEPLALRGTRLGALVVPDARLSAAGTPNAIDSMLAAARRDADAGRGAGVARQVHVTLRGVRGPVAAVVALAAPLPEPAPLPPAVAPARLMYAVRAATAPAPAAPVGKDAFARLDPATGGSWQYELQQLRFANARLEEEIAELEQGERERAAEEARERVRARERRVAREQEQRRYVSEGDVYEGDVYSQQQQQLMGMGMGVPRYYEELQAPPQPQWASYPGPAYQLPMKRAWDRRDE
ncbi:hypothetical protein B0H11DRAFT_2297156 [Mycena galericulata]|nr:hypothetical protein B0H11DRAFT_2297156 [Mycena galericulata]